MFVTVAMLLVVALAGCSSPSTAGSPETASAPAAAPGPPPEKGGQDMYGPYEVVENWLQPLPDDTHSHDGYTWGSQAAVYAESPDRIWIAQRGELPLPKGAKPWTPYAQIIPSPGAATGPRDMRYRHVIFVVNRDGKMVQSWPQHDQLFDQPKAPLGPRGPHKIKISPYDPEKHVWVIDDNLHQIFKFTYDGKLVMTLGQMGVEGRGPNTFARPTDIAWLPDGTFFISDGYHGKRVAKFDRNGKFLMDWGSAPADPKNPGPNEWNTVHSISISKDRKLYVADRGHERFQVFDENGKFLDMFSTREAHWPTGVRSVSVDGRRRNTARAEVRPEGQFPVWMGAAGRTAGPVLGTASNDGRPGRQSLRCRSTERPHPEVPAEEKCGPVKVDRSGGAPRVVEQLTSCVLAF
jgi:hypothetical protein